MLEKEGDAGCYVKKRGVFSARSVNINENNQKNVNITRTPTFSLASVQTFGKNTKCFTILPSYIFQI